MTAFQTSFFSFLSLVFAIYSGNTMAFLYDVSRSFQTELPALLACSHRTRMTSHATAQRQKEMVKQLYSETMALEELLEEAVNTLGPDARDIILQIRYASSRLSSGAASSTSAGRLL